MKTVAWQRGGAYLALALIFAILVQTQFKGVDFGHHWDEPVHWQAMQRMVQSGQLLPGNYTYPGMMYWTMIAASAGRMTEAYGQVKHTFKPFTTGNLQDGLEIHADSVAKVGEVLSGRIFTHEHRLNVRRLFILFSAVTLFGVYWLAREMRVGRAGAVLAAALYAFSWEIAYHSRWIAVDTILILFVVLAVAACLRSLRSPTPSPWLIVGAVNAALAAGTKYPAGLLLLPVFLAAFLVYRGHWWKLAGQAGLLVMVFGVVFMLTTPAAMVEPLLFLQHLEFAKVGYFYGWFGYTVRPFFEHLGRNTLYVSLVLMSPYKWLALMVFALSGWGFYLAFREDRRAWLLSSIYPVLFFFYMSAQWAMIVRNVIQLAPFMAVWSVIGFGAALKLLPKPWARYSAWGALLMVVILNVGWLYATADSIAKRRSPIYLQELASYFDRHARTYFYLSPGVRQALQQHRVGLPRIMADTAADADLVCIFHRECADGELAWVPANDPWFIRRVIGPMEVNMNYYPSWGGDDRILIMRSSKFLKMDERVTRMKAIMEARRAETPLREERQP